MAVVPDLGSIFTSVRVPPPIADPTGGLLEPAIAPINFIVSKVEEAVLSAMNESILAVRMTLGTLTDELAGAVDAAFGSMYSDGTQAINAAATVMKSAIVDIESAGQDGLNIAYSILDGIDNLAEQVVTHATGYAANISNILTQNLGNITEESNKLADAARSTLQTELQRELRQLTDQLLSVTNRVGSATRSTARQLANTADNITLTAAATIDDVVRRSSQDARSDLSAARITASDAMATLRNTRQKATSAITRAELAAKQTYSDINVVPLLESYNQRAQRALSSGETLRDAITVISVVIVIGTLYVTYRLYCALIRPRIRDQI